MDLLKPTSTGAERVTTSDSSRDFIHDLSVRLIKLEQHFGRQGGKPTLDYGKTLQSLLSSLESSQKYSQDQAEFLNSLSERMCSHEEQLRSSHEQRDSYIY